MVEVAQPLKAELADAVGTELTARRLDRQLDPVDERLDVGGAVTCRLWVERSSAARSLVRSKRWRSPSRFKTKTGSRSRRS